MQEMRLPAVGLTGTYNQSGYMSIQPTPWQSILLCLPGLIQVRFEITGHMVQLGLSPLPHLADHPECAS